MSRAGVAGVLVLAFIACTAADCSPPETSNDKQRQQQEVLLSEGTSQVGMPAIHNFRERKLLKDILEMRDQDGLVTYTYLFADMSGKLQFFCDSIGYGIPYATQFTAPESVQRWKLPYISSGDGYYGHERLPQPDPNGLFSPPAAEGTWVICRDPNGKSTQPVYVEPRIVVSPFKLPIG